MIDNTKALNALDPTILTALKLLTPEMLTKYADWLMPEDETNGQSTTDILRRVIMPVLEKVETLEDADEQTFIQEMDATLRAVVKKGDAGRMERLARIINRLQQMVMAELLKQIGEEMRA